MASKKPFQQGLHDEIIIDNFAGGGGASTGIEAAIGRPVDIAVNHDPEAIVTHEANHPFTEHHCENVWDIDPVKVTRGRPVGLAWFSPDCKHFSKAKGGKPVEKKIRGLAWLVVKYGATVRPRVMIVENVEEFQKWGPLIPKLDEPLHTITTKERFGIVTVDSVDYIIVDIGMRMLQPRELFRAQGFPDSYIIDPMYNGKPLTKGAQVRMCGNSVPPDPAEALVKANYANSWVGMDFLAKPLWSNERRAAL